MDAAMDAIDQVRRFNRFFTRAVGALNPRFLGTDLSLAEARILLEIASREAPLAMEIGEALGMDTGFLSRVLGRFEARGWIARERGQGDARRRPIALTEAGRAAFAEMDARQRAEVAAMLARLAPSRRTDLVEALGRARLLLDPAAARRFRLRPFRPGDVGLVVARQTLLYEDLHGWGRGIEANEAAVAAAFLRDFKPGREQCWIGEIDGVMAGSIFLTDEGDGLCRLRLLYVEPFARGLGLGAALVDECLGFARRVGYRAMTLWTHTVLADARRLYASRGFALTGTESHDTFGEVVQGETWRLDLAAISFSKPSPAPGSISRPN